MTHQDVQDEVTALRNADTGANLRGDQLPTIIGRYYDGSIALAASNTAMATNRQYAGLFVVNTALTIDRLGIQVSTASAASTGVKLGVFGVDSNHLPSGAALYQSGELLTDSTGLKEASLSLALTPGVYYAAAIFSGTPTVRTRLAASAPVLGFSTNGAASAPSGDAPATALLLKTDGQSYASGLTDWAGVTNATSQTVPSIRYRIASKP